MNIRIVVSARAIEAVEAFMEDMRCHLDDASTDADRMRCHNLLEGLREVRGHLTGEKQ